MNGHKSKRLNHDELTALRGLRLPANALERLRKTGIYCEPAVSIEHQNLADRYVLRGVESGGAVAELGAYCSFVDMEGGCLPWLQTVETIGVNGLHAIVLASSFVRVQVFRFGHTYDLLITSHMLGGIESGQRPRLDNSVLFRGRHGTIAMDLWDKDRNGRGLIAPVFHDRSGEPLTVPAMFMRAVQQTVAGACCVGCRHSHLLVPPQEVTNTTATGQNDGQNKIQSC